MLALPTERASIRIFVFFVTMRTFRTEAIIIKRRNIGEADRILTVFSKDYGKLAVKATGIRKVPSKRSPHVELLNHSMLTLYKGNGFPVLTEAQTIEDFSTIKTDLTHIGYAYHLCELIDRLCPENQEQRQVFDLLKSMLHRLERGEMQAFAPIENSLSLADATKKDRNTKTAMLSLLHMFEIELLSLLGYWNKSHAFTQAFNTEDFIEQIIERKLKSKKIFVKLD
jgi:DNA repair protein RecO (recombination protein O)